MVVLHFIACGWYLMGCETLGVHHAKCFSKRWATGGDSRAIIESPKAEVHQHRRRRTHGHEKAANGTKPLVSPSMSSPFKLRSYWYLAKTFCAHQC